LTSSVLERLSELLHPRDVDKWEGAKIRILNAASLEVESR
jgi:hypothetical protein